MKSLILIALALLLPGCALLTGEPTEAQKVDLQTALAKRDTLVAEAKLAETTLRRSETIRETARYSAISDISKAKTKSQANDMLAMGLAMEGVIHASKTGNEAKPNVVAAPAQVQPQRGRDLYDWVMGLGALGIQGLGIQSNRDVAIRQSDNNAAITLGSYQALDHMGSYVQAPGSTSTVYNSLGGPGVIGSGSYSTVYTQTDTRTASGAGASTSGNAAYTDARTASGAGASTAGAGSYQTQDSHAVDDHGVVWQAVP